MVLEVREYEGTRKCRVESGVLLAQFVIVDWVTGAVEVLRLVRALRLMHVVRLQQLKGPFHIQGHSLASDRASGSLGFG